MLASLSIKNFALINSLQVDFYKNYSVITGETGAGKSIILGALGLVLGNRADVNSLKNPEKKCVIEAEFQVSDYNLATVFELLDLDYESDTIIRREILPSGKSRAFVNDTPVTLKTLQEIQAQLIDIHSQHNTRELSDKKYAYWIVDSLAENHDLIKDYQKILKSYKAAVKALDLLKADQVSANEKHEYNLYLYKELEAAKLKEIDEIEVLESEIDQLSNVEAIKTSLSEALQLSTAEELGIQAQLQQMSTVLQKISKFNTTFNGIYDRAESLKIELDDLAIELENELEKVEDDPERLTTVSQRLTLLFELQKKHQVSSLASLIEVKEQLALQVAQVENADELLKEKSLLVEKLKKEVITVAQKISKKRKGITAGFETEIKSILANLGMENATFKIDISAKDIPNELGMDEINLMLASNKGSQLGLLNKVASGGELSRIMLAIKLILSKVVSLPTIIFDEIDTGVSGEVATKIAHLMKAMGENMQVITITHLPQVAALGNTHYKVFKKVEGEETTTYLNELEKEARVTEIAEMIGGKEISKSALEHATQLLSIS